MPQRATHFVRAYACAPASAPPTLSLHGNVARVAHYGMAAALVPPFLRAVPPRCSIVVDLHAHKNGGSSMRDLYLDNELGDDWLYWGYRLDAIEQMATALLRLLLQTGGNSSSPSPIRLLAELHYSYKSARDVLAAFGPRSPLQLIAPRSGCRIVLFTRLRRPLEHYISFYRWTVGWRQRLNASAFGAGFIEWLPRNLQAALLMHAFDANAADYFGARTAEGGRQRAAFWQFDEPSTWPAGLRMPDQRAPLGRARVARLRRTLASLDLVGLVERFDETLVSKRRRPRIMRAQRQTAREEPAASLGSLATPPCPPSIPPSHRCTHCANGRAVAVGSCCWQT